MKIRRMPIRAEITFVNLIDVTLVLLIIFMITAPAMREMLEVNLPVAKASDANISEGIVVSILTDGGITVGREKMGPEDFEKGFTTIWEKRSGEPTFVNADTDVPYGAVIDVISTMKKLGVQDIGLVVKRDETAAK